MDTFSVVVIIVLLLALLFFAVTNMNRDSGGTTRVSYPQGGGYGGGCGRG